MMSVFFALIWVIFVFLSIAGTVRQFSFTTLVVQLAGLVGLSKALLDSLSKDNLRVYFLLHRMRIRWQSQAVTRWWFAARYDGDYTRQIIPETLRFLNDKSRFRFSVKLDYQGENELQVEVAETLVLKISFDALDDLPHAQAHVTVVSKTIEVSYGYTKEKLEQQIVPILDALKTFLAPAGCSFELNVDFTGPNPFFAVYVSHLRPDQIGDFKVVLRLNAYSALSANEKVEISKSKLHVTAFSTDVFRKLATDFILLSPDVKALSGVTRA